MSEELREAIARSLLIMYGAGLEDGQLGVTKPSIPMQNELDQILCIIGERCWLKDERELDITGLIELLAGHDLTTRLAYNKAFDGFGALLESWLKKEAGWRPVKEIKVE